MSNPTSFRISEEALELLDAIAKYNGVNRTAALEFIIREHAERKGLRQPPKKTRRKKA